MIAGKEKLKSYMRKQLNCIKSIKEQAIECIEKSIKLNQEIDNLPGLAETIYYKGIIYHETGHDIEKAMSYFEEALELFRKIDDAKGIGKGTKIYKRKSGITERNR